MSIRCAFPYRNFSQAYAKLRDDLNELAELHDRNPANAAYPFFARVKRSEAQISDGGWQIRVEGLSDDEAIVLAFRANGSYSVCSDAPQSAAMEPGEREWAYAMESIAPAYPPAATFRLDEELGGKPATSRPSAGRPKV